MAFETNRSRREWVKLYVVYMGYFVLLYTWYVFNCSATPHTMSTIVVPALLGLSFVIWRTWLHSRTQVCLMLLSERCSHGFATQTSDVVSEDNAAAAAAAALSLFSYSRGMSRIWILAALALPAALKKVKKTPSDLSRASRASSTSTPKNRCTGIRYQVPGTRSTWS